MLYYIYKRFPEIKRQSSPATRVIIYYLESDTDYNRGLFPLWKEGRIGKVFRLPLHEEIYNYRFKAIYDLPIGTLIIVKDSTWIELK